MKLTEAIIDDVVDECAAALLKARVSDDDALDFLDIVSGIMHDYRDVVGEDCEVAHAVGKRFGRVEFYLSVPGAWIDLFERGQGARKRSIFRKVSSFTTELGTTISYLYNGRNHVSVLAASRREGTGFLGQPMVRASIAGLVLGLACQLLPADVAAFLVDGIASPLLSLSVTILSGIMGPIIFLSLVSSIIALGDIDTLNSLGTKVFVRFLLIAALICGITLAWHLPSSPSSATRARDSTPMPSSTSCSPSSRPTS